MKGALSLVASIALGPAMIGPLDAVTERLTLALCGSGASLSLTIPVQTPPPPGSGPCCAKGCHGNSNRKRIDRAQ